MGMILVEARGLLRCCRAWGEEASLYPALPLEMGSPLPLAAPVPVSAETRYPLLWWH